MIPSVISKQLKQGVDDFLRTTFPISTNAFSGVVDDLLKEEGELFKGPYVSINLPFRNPPDDQKNFFADIPMKYQPYQHQLKAFQRLTANKSTIIATGTGSGKTECFLYPVLDYCYKKRNNKGIKAIIIYPMNALATDQAKRIAKAIYDNKKLRGNVTAGLFIGQEENDPKDSMTRDHVITNKDTLRENPPDILLTNYKMLDYLMVRVKDRELWQHNNPETLKYLIVDELHTFDGAQGTDLSCLIRRLKNRLEVPANHLCCVGTSATIGSEEEINNLLSYIKDVFSDNFDKESIVTEDRESSKEFLSKDIVEYDSVPEPSQALELKPEHYDSPYEFLQAQYRLWFGADLDMNSEEDRLELGRQLKKHRFFQNLLIILNGRTLGLQNIIDELKQISVFQSDEERDYCVDLVNSICALISHARSSIEGEILPFLNVRYQLWMRELRRIVAETSHNPKLAFSDDLKEDQENKFLPIVHCRECGSTGWGGVRTEDNTINDNLRDFYQAFFKKQPSLTFLFPVNLGEKDDSNKSSRLCGKCLAVPNQTTECPSCHNKELIEVFIPDNITRNKDDKVVTNDNCPYCGSHGGLTIMGSRAASLISVMVGQLFASRYGDKNQKLVSFADSVQDVSLYAGFLGARTYSINFRSALQQLVVKQGEGRSLSELPDLFIKYWTEELGLEKYISYFIAHNMEWLSDYDYMKKKGQLPADSELKELVDKRISWEIFSEYGYRSRIGRTLEKSSVSTVFPRVELVDKTAKELAEVVQNEIGAFRDTTIDQYVKFICGLIMHLKTKGGVSHSALDEYINENGNSYLLNRQSFMPSFWDRAPVFLTSRKRGKSRFETILSNQGRQATWYEKWLFKLFGTDQAFIKNYAEDFYKIALSKLEANGFLDKYAINNEQFTWGLKPDHLELTLKVAQLRCDKCSHSVSTAGEELKNWVSMPCMRPSCNGQYQEEHTKDDYYGKLYSSANIYRIHAEEHTSLLDRDERETVEKSFINNENPWDPNLLSATPTLEMGINIGDLSSVFLCSVPPAQSNYIQRIGRAGRTDGNAFTFTMAEGVSHDLYFFAEPEEMINGQVNPPGVYLNASAILERQFVAFCFDKWVSTGITEKAIPEKLGPVLNNIESNKHANFPYTFLRFTQKQKDMLLQEFFELFKDVLDGDSCKHIQIYVEGDKHHEGSLEHKLINSLEFVSRERDAYKKKAAKLRLAINKKEDDPAQRDKNFEDDLDELINQRKGLEKLIRGINDKDILNFFTDEGFLPNYAFPEAGVILKSLIFRRKQKNRASDEEPNSNYDTWTYEYERPAMSAIQELAPANTFYANGRKVEIDQVDLSLTEPQMWRFCDECSYSEAVDIGTTSSSCPKCGSAMWGDIGQQRKMLKLRQVYASSSDKKSRIGDDAEERTPVFYNKQMLVDFVDDNIQDAFRVTDESFPFGFEFIKKATFREINFGERALDGDLFKVAGVESSRNGFKLCKHCGKIQKEKPLSDTKPDDIRRMHDINCPLRSKENNSTDFIDCVYLYREFHSEAIRMLLPILQELESPQKRHSFIAALQLGLKSKFGGAVDHLQITTYDEPDENSDHRKQFLMLYDRIPGGTGYLKQLMRDEKPLFEVFELALDKLKKCTCANDPDKDGCYRCIYAYRNSYDMPLTSRETAIKLLTEALEHKEKLSKIESLRKVSLNALSGSVLESNFIDALKKYKNEGTSIQVFQEIVNKKPGYFIKIGERGYYVEPQVSLDASCGVSVPSKADFVFYPADSKSSKKPIVVFTDGFKYHRDRLGYDTAQRMALVQSGKFWTWSITWKDVQSILDNFDKKYFIDLFNCGVTQNEAKLGKFLASFGIDQFKSLAKNTSNFDLLVSFLAEPDEEAWSKHAFVRSLIWLDLKATDHTAFDKEVLKHLPSEMKGIYDELAEDKFISRYDHQKNSSKIIQIFVSIPKNDFQTKKYNNAFFMCVLLDRKHGNDFESDWVSFLRVYNLMQFLPISFCLTSRGVESLEYEKLHLDRILRRNDSKADIVTEEWAEVLELSDESFSDLISKLQTRLNMMPEVGFELQNVDDEIIAEAELAWKDSRIAILASFQANYKNIFSNHGWKVYMIEKALDNMSELISSIEKKEMNRL